MNLETDPKGRPGRPKSEQKRHDISHAAAHLFLAEGFDRTSMDSVAHAAGVSKQTVYSHFKSKDDLFISCISRKMDEFRLALNPEEHRSLESGLSALADGYLRLLADPPVISMWRLVMNEASGRERVARLFYQTGPQPTYDHLGAFLEQHAHRLNTDDYAGASRVFMALTSDHYQMKLMLGLMDGITTEERQQHVKNVIHRFLRIFARD